MTDSRREKRRATRRTAPSAATAPPAARPTARDEIAAELSSPRFLGLLAALVLAGFFYVRNTMGDAERPYVLLGVGVIGFVFGSSSGVNPRRVVVACGALVCAGLALVATRPSEVGVALSLGAGMGLAGGIHRLGRLGPDEEDQPARPA